MNYLKFKSKFLFAITFLFFFSTSAWLIVYVPSNNDEFLPYHRIACEVFPNAIEHVFIESCTSYPSRLLGLEFFRSYSIVGYTSNLLYWPFYQAFPAPASHHVLGALVLLLFSIWLIKAFSLSKLTLVIPLIYFPMLFQTIHDTGPIRIALLSYPLVVLSVTKLFDGSSSLLRRGLVFLGIFLVVSFAIEDKPFYIYLLPQVLFLALGFAYCRHCDMIKLTFKKERVFFEIEKKFAFEIFLVVLAVFFAILLTLIFITVPVGSKLSYYPFLVDLVLQTISPRFSFLQEIKYLAGYLLAPTQFANRIYELSVPQKLISIFAFIPVLILCLVALRNEENKIRFVILGTIGLGVAIFLYTRHVWTGHHFIFLHIPILILLMRYASCGEQKYAYVVVSILLSTIVSCVQLSLGKESVHSESTRQPIFDYLSRDEIASNVIINFVSWGGYYQQSLYGARTQLVTFNDTTTQESADGLVEVWARSGRKEIINICSGCDAQAISSFFPEYKISTVDFPNTSWRLVRIER
jgi:hypothetical protein